MSSVMAVAVSHQPPSAPGRRLPDRPHAGASLTRKSAARSSGPNSADRRSQGGGRQHHRAAGDDRTLDPPLPPHHATERSPEFDQRCVKGRLSSTRFPSPCSDLFLDVQPLAWLRPPGGR